MKPDNKCFFCGVELESNQHVCPNCGKMQNPTNHLEQPNVYTTLQDVANAMKAGEEFFFARGEEMEYKPENYKTFIKNFLRATFFSWCTLMFICYQLSLGIWGYFGVCLLMGLFFTYSYTTRKTRSLYMNLVAGNFFQSDSDNSPLSGYSIKKAPDGKFVLKRNWAYNISKYKQRIYIYGTLLVILIMTIFVLFFPNLFVELFSKK